MTHDLYIAEKQNHQRYIRQGRTEKQNGCVPAVQSHHRGTVQRTDYTDGVMA